MESKPTESPGEPASVTRYQTALGCLTMSALVLTVVGVMAAAVVVFGVRT